MNSRNQAKPHRPGRITRNPFLNFLRDYRKNHCNMTVVQIACEGAKEWRAMSDEQKQQYMRGPRVDNTKGKKRKASKMAAPRSPKMSQSPRESKSPRRSMSKSA
ncbi:Protamine and protamine like [Popillia japonica]|uniref:Protamine and protamine like n=1 Tax=Popillia japonica TaxID=7064 RepID=A0AAW1IXD2_POPJA